MNGMLDVQSLIYRMMRKVVRTLSPHLVRNDPSAMWGRIFDLDKKRLVDLGGFRLYVMTNDYIGGAIEKSRVYEPHITKLLNGVLREGDVFLDLGANIGYFTILASALTGLTGKVIAFEPNPQNLQLLYSSIIANEVKNVTVYPYAASNTMGILRFTTVGSNGGIVTEHSKYQKHFLLVQSVLLDQVLSEENRLDLIKIDIEAHEPSALKGMESLLKKHKPKIITEFHPWAMRLNNAEAPQEYLQEIYSYGYQLSIILPTGELQNVSNSEEIMTYWESLNQETAHLDLYARQP